MPTIELDTAIAPLRMDETYFRTDGFAKPYLREIENDVFNAWIHLFNDAPHRIYVGGSHSYGNFGKESDLDIIVHRDGVPLGIFEERRKLSELLERKYDIFVNEWWGDTGKAGTVDLIITSIPFGRLYDIINGKWVSVKGNSRHPDMDNRREITKNLPAHLQYMALDMGVLNILLHGQDKVIF